VRPWLLLLIRATISTNSWTNSASSRSRKPRSRWRPFAAILREIPGLQVPDHWPPRYPDIEPLTVAGEPASEQLIRERQ
jgi:hypothetical protein